MQVDISIDGESYRLGKIKNITKVTSKEGYIQFWRNDYCIATYSLEEYAKTLNFEVVEEDE
jgi:hypothetical protein